VIKTWEVGSPARVDFESLVKRRDSYIPFTEMRVTEHYPLVEGYKNDGRRRCAAAAWPIRWASTR